MALLPNPWGLGVAILLHASLTAFRCLAETLGGALRGTSGHGSESDTITPHHHAKVHNSCSPQGILILCHLPSSSFTVSWGVTTDLGVGVQVPPGAPDNPVHMSFKQESRKAYVEPV